MAIRRKRHIKANGESSRSMFYNSFEEWEAENFPNIVKRKEREELEEDPEAVSKAIATDIFRQVGVELLHTP